VAALRPPEYDEAYSLFLVAGHARPDWPAGVFTAGSVRGVYAGGASFGQIVHDLRAGDVHPPLYFWALEMWRQVAGDSWLAARALSAGFAVAGLALVAGLAEDAGVPVLPAVAMTLLAYGFAYTGSVARGFALAQMLLLLGLRWQDKRPLAAGAVLGAACFTNYLALFVALAAAGRRWRALVAMLPFLAGAAWFFVAQKGSRAGQFAQWGTGHVITLLGKDMGAAWFGGLPLYAGAWGGAVAVALGLLAVASAVCVVRARHPSAPGFLLLAAATPVGLLGLGLVFHNTPIEIRYVAFALPYVALLLAPALPRALLGLMLAVQAVGIAGLMLSPLTMQPQGLAARAAPPGALVLVPFGNDGVGIPGPFIAASPDSLRLFLLRPGVVAPPGLYAELPVDNASKAVFAASGCAPALLTTCPP
jgi:hypothetical protein